MNTKLSPNNSFGPSFWSNASLSLLVCGGLALLAGCASEPESHVVSAPPPPAPATQVVVTQPAQPAVQAVQTPAGTVLVTQAPPTTIQQDVVTAQPSTAHKWIPGYWTWRNSRYEWITGHWEVPPSRDSVWIAPRWEQTDSGAFRFYEGYWN